ncbi:MAG: CapA family protein [Rhodocyclaceae bacterium]|nr:CapA family protein [Rhodocyclaceae bacterium]
MNELTEIGDDASMAIRLAFVGDICLGKAVKEGLRDQNGGDLFAKVRHLLGRADLAVGNLECALVPDGFRHSPDHGSMTVPASLVDRDMLEPFSVLGLANNHVMDAGIQGLTATKAFLGQNQFACFGADSDLPGAEDCCVVEVGGMRIAFVGACDVQKYYAGDSRPGVAPLIETRLVSRVKVAREKADLVIVVLHADLEFSHHPSPQRVKLSRHLIDAGADAVIQHHPHVCQGIERYRGRVIAYSLGNFVFPVSENLYMRRHSGTNWGLILFLHIERCSSGHKMSFTFEPVIIGGDNCPAPSIGSERSSQIETIEEISRDLGNNRLIRYRWWQRCIVEAKSTYYVLAHCRRKSGTLAMLKAVIELLRDPYERRWMYGVLTAGFMG